MASLSSFYGLLLFAFFSSTSSAMGVLHSGTNACYTVRNQSQEDLQNVVVVSGEDPNRSFLGAAQVRGNAFTLPPEKPDPAMPYSFSAGGSCFFWDTGHKVPETVLVSWHSSEQPSTKKDPDSFAGPHRVEVRSLVPKEIFALARDRDYRYRIGFSISVGVDPVRVNWVLEYRHPKPIYAEDLRPYRRIGPHTELLCVGGDNFEPLNLEVFEWGAGSGGAGISVPVWPHCGLR